MESQPKPDTKRVLEALLFAADEPITIRQIRRILPEADAKEVQQAIAALREEYDREERSFQIVEIERGYQVFTRKEYFPSIRKMRSDLKAMRLSRAAVETLAIIAYRQPVTRPEIEQIRGVDAGGVLKTLLDRSLITLQGRAEGVGRPILYGTTDHFLNHFGLKSLEDLPKLEELTELMKSREMEEVEEEADRRLGPVPGGEEPAPDGAGQEAEEDRAEEAVPAGAAVGGDAGAEEPSPFGEEERPPADGVERGAPEDEAPPEKTGSPERDPDRTAAGGG